MASNDDLRDQFEKTRAEVMEMARMIGCRARNMAGETAEAARDTGQKAYDTVAENVGERPLLSVGLAVGAGALLAKSLRRQGR